MPFGDQARVTNAVRLDIAEAFSADSPVALDAIAHSDDLLAPAGETFDVAPYRFVIMKESFLAPAVESALQSPIGDGPYMKILSDAGVERGGLKWATIMPGTNVPIA